MNRYWLWVYFICLTVMPVTALASPLADLKLLAGFKIEKYASVPSARSLVVARELGVVFVGSRGDTIRVIHDKNWDGKAEKVTELFRKFKVPNGIAWKEGALYIAEQHRIVRLTGKTLAEIDRSEPEVLFDALPDDGWHGWRYAAFGPDGGLYVAVGVPCNICAASGIEDAIIRLDPKTLKVSTFATGVRNSVGIDFHPKTGEMFFTDNGADNMGDDSPPDELNFAPTPGLFFGYPYFGGGADRTRQFKGDELPAPATMPVVNFQAHVAPLGVHFYRGDMFPDDYRTDAFVAQHGSWNRSTPVGYQIMRIKMTEDGTVLGKEPFITGWLKENGDHTGRPVDIKTLPDGSIIISDDSEGMVYRVRYEKP